MKLARWLLGALTLLGLSASARCALADVAAAEALFRDGRRLLEAGDYERACSKLAESEAQDPSSGTLINLALCHEKQGKIATAWAEYQAALRLARQQRRTDRAQVAEQLAANLEPRVPRVLLTSSQVLAGRTLALGGFKITDAALNSPLPLNPGEYELVVTAPGFQSRTQTFALHEGEQRNLEVPVLEPLTPVASAPASHAPRASTPTSEQATPLLARHVAKSRPVLPIALVVGGGAALAMGVGFGVASLSRYGHANRSCPTHHACSADAMQARRDAETTAWVANAALAGGALATAVGAWLMLRATPGHERTVALVQPLANGAWLGVSSRF